MAVCTVCQNPNEPGQQYCARCGSQLPVAAAQPNFSGSDTPDSLNDQAIRAISRNEIPDALELVDRALGIDANHLPSMRTRADILRRIGLTNQAAAEEAKIRAIGGGDVVYARFWTRFGASFLDGIFTALLSLAPGAIVVAAIYFSIVPDSPTNKEEEDALNNALLGWYAVSGAVAFVYGWLLNARGGTWGKRIVGIRVISIHTGEHIGLSRSFLRMLVSYVGAGVLYLGWFWMIWDKNKQTWHDKAAGSVVVTGHPSDPPPTPPFAR